MGTIEEICGEVDQDIRTREEVLAELTANEQ